jgi:hypothetical protein
MHIASFSLDVVELVVLKPTDGSVNGENSQHHLQLDARQGCARVLREPRMQILYSNDMLKRLHGWQKRRQSWCEGPKCNWMVLGECRRMGSLEAVRLTGMSFTTSEPYSRNLATARPRKTFFHDVS